MRRKFIIRRTHARYPDRSIVCDCCHRRLPRSFYYEIIENGMLTNIYPFHNLECTMLFIADRLMNGVNINQYDIEIEPGSEDDPLQEETTE